MTGLVVPVRPPAARAMATCRGCGARQEVAGDATGFECALCGTAWRWAGCGGCGRLSLHDEAVESWRCRECHTANRSWWRTTTARREERAVAAQREAVRRERRSLRTRLRRHRRVLTVSLASLLATVVVVVLLVVAAPAPVGERTRAACAMSTQLRPSLFNGSMDGAAVRMRLHELADTAARAEPAVAAAAASLAAERQLGGPDLERALLALDDACAGRVG